MRHGRVRHGKSGDTWLPPRRHELNAELQAAGLRNVYVVGVEGHRAWARRDPTLNATPWTSPRPRDAMAEASITSLPTRLKLDRSPQVSDSTAACQTERRAAPNRRTGRGPLKKSPGIQRPRNSAVRRGASLGLARGGAVET